MLGSPADQVDGSSRSAMCDAIVPVERQSAMQQLLNKAMSLAPSMIESKGMCLHVLERLERISILIEASEQQMPQQAINRFSTILGTYVDFLKKFSNKKAAFRLVYNRKIMSQNVTFHDDIDNLLRGLNLPEEEWRPQWEGYRDAQQDAFEAMSRNRMALMGGLRDAQVRTELQSLLVFEFYQVNSKYTAKELKVLNDAFHMATLGFSKLRIPTIGTWFLPPYEFECDETPFAWGAFGTVHHGKHSGSDVVIKRAKISSEADRAAFVREANTWFNANRIPNVVRLFGAYHFGSNPYFVCEYASNGTLSDYLHKEENRHITWKLLHETALGLRDLHRLKIVHNDLKCNNILVATDGIAKLTDFGLSSQLSAQQSQSVSKPVGAYSWKAPELLAGTSVPTYESDIFSFAMCIYEAVSHTAPWVNVDDAMIRRNVKKGILPKRPEGFTDEQWALILAMTAFKPEDRLSMDGVVSQLEKFAAAEYNTAHFPSESLRISDSTSVVIVDTKADTINDELEALIYSGGFADQSLLETLENARALCGEMRESQDMCLHVIQRFVTTFREVSSGNTEPRAQLMKDGKTVALRYLQFLNTYGNQNALYRLVHNHTVIDKTVQFHEDIDTLLDGFGFAGENKELREWRQVSQDLQDAQLSAFKVMIESAEFDELLEKQSRAEALALLRFESNQLDSGRTNSELEVINIAVGKLVEVFRESTPSLAPWFLPPHKLQADETPFPFDNDSSVQFGKLGSSQVVVKRVIVASEAERNAFVRETDLWFSANEVPGVLQLRGAYQFGANPYVVSEFAANGTLNDFLFNDENRHLTWKLLLQAASGLQSLHQLGVLHNDLTCSHILVDSDETAKITIFGLSSPLSGPIASGVMKIITTVGWKAPELFASNPPSVASDVYALGMCIIEAVSLASPWEGVAENDIRRYLRYGRLPAKHENFTDKQWELVKAMCAHDSEKRLSMEDVIVRLHVFAVSPLNIRDETGENHHFRTTFALFDGAQGSSVDLAREMTEKHMNNSCPELRENESLCKLLLGDVTKILHSMKTLEETKIQPDVRTTALIEEVCTRLHVFCTKHSQPRHIFYALARNRLVTQELEEIRPMVKKLFSILKLGKPRASGDTWTELLLIQKAQMKFQLIATHDHSEVLPDRASQVESMTILRYELSLAARSQSPAAALTELLGHAYKKIVFFYKMEMKTIPAWFIPQYAVDCAADAIGEGSYGVVYRGVL